MLLTHRRQTAADLEAWGALERADALWAQTAVHRARVDRARVALRAFAREDAGGYAGVSWGKDSTCLAHLVATEAPHLPLVWVRFGRWDNPDCELVRDAFLAAHPGVAYEEHQMAGDGALDTVEVREMFRGPAERHGRRHASGVRAVESRSRRLRMARWGLRSPNSCAPLGWWQVSDVFAYLWAHELPVHPAYACSYGGALPRERIRVDGLGGSEGTGHGRAEWESAYYRRELAALRGVTQSPGPAIGG